MAEEQKPVEKKEETNAIAVLSYIGILFLVPLLAAKDDEFAKFHAKQGLVLFIAEICTMVLYIIPVLGWILGVVAWLMWVVLSIIGIVNVLGGKKEKLPVIGGIADKFKI